MRRFRLTSSTFAPSAFGFAAIAAGSALILLAAFQLPTAATLTALGLLIAISGLAVSVYFYDLGQRDELFRREFGQIRGLLRVGENSTIGLAEVEQDAMDVDYTGLIVGAERLTIVMNDGRAWLLRNKDALQTRLLDKTKKTRVFLLNPSSPFVDTHARKSMMDPGAIRDRILETVGFLEEIRQSDSDLQIFGHKLYNTYSLCMGDEEAIWIPYFISRGNRKVPALRFVDTGKSCFFRDLREDIELLMLDVEEISRRESKVISLGRAGGLT